MNKEEIESLFKKYKVRIPKEKQGQSECYECKIHHKYSLTWTSFLYEYKENYYCFEHIVNILLQQENQSLKKQLENKYSKTGILTNEVLYEENTKLINQQKEFMEYINEKIDICDGFIDTIRSDLENISYGGRIAGKTYIANEIMKNEVAKKTLEEILSKYKSIIGGKE